MFSFFSLHQRSLMFQSNTLFISAAILVVLFLNNFAPGQTASNAKLKPSDRPTTSVIAVDLAKFTTDSLKSHNKSTTGDLIITIKGLRSDKGHVRAGLFDDTEGWPAEWTQNAPAWGKAEIKNGVAVFHIKGLPVGKYGLNGYHDENDSNDLDAGLLGIPKEGYCFSTDYKPLLRAPSFKNVEFLFKPDKKTGAMVISITMQYR